MATDSVPTLVIGNMALSSWSLRPWILMKGFGLPFEVVKIRLDVPATREALKAHSPSGLVPVLKDGEQTIFDSLAIAETCAERHPDLPFWPKEPDARAFARSIVAEMHAGYQTLRTVWPMDVVTENAGVIVPPGVKRDLNHMVSRWEEAMSTYRPAGAGPFLFGSFGIADAFFAPVVFRIRPYGPYPLPPASAAWYDAMLHHPAMQEWMVGAQEEAALGWYTLHASA